MKTYRAAVIGCSRMGGFIDNEVVDSPRHVPPYSHAAGFYACDRTESGGLRRLSHRCDGRVLANGMIFHQNDNILTIKR